MTRGQLRAALSMARYATLRAHRDLREISEGLESDDLPRAKRAALELKESTEHAIQELQSIDDVIETKTGLRK